MIEKNVSFVSNDLKYLKTIKGETIKKIVRTNIENEEEEYILFFESGYSLTMKSGIAGYIVYWINDKVATSKINDKLSEKIKILEEELKTLKGEVE